MAAWFASLGALERVLAGLALLGGILFLIQVVITFIGMGDADGGADADLDADVNVDVDVDTSGSGDGSAHMVHDAHPMLTFKLLSFQGLTGFFMMFGLVGLAMSRAQQGAVASLAVGAAAGFGLVWVADKIFRFFGSLQHSGTVKLHRAINEEGTIYLGIPAGDAGKVRVTVQGRQMVLTAVSEDQSAIPTDTRVRVVNVTNGNVMVVRKL